MSGNSLNSKIREIISCYRMSDRQFSLKIGVNPSVIGSMFQKNTEPSAKIIRNTLLTFPEISSDWLLKDEGTMLRQPDKNLERMEKLIDTISILQDALNTKIKEVEMLRQKLNNKELEG